MVDKLRGGITDFSSECEQVQAIRTLYYRYASMLFVISSLLVKKLTLERVIDSDEVIIKTINSMVSLSMHISKVFTMRVKLAKGCELVTNH